MCTVPVNVFIVGSDRFAVFLSPLCLLHTHQLFSQSALQGCGKIDARRASGVQQITTDAHVSGSLRDGSRCRVAISFFLMMRINYAHAPFPFSRPSL